MTDYPHRLSNGTKVTGLGGKKTYEPDPKPTTTKKKGRGK